MSYLEPLLLVSFSLLLFFFITINLINFFEKRNKTAEIKSYYNPPVSILIAMKNEKTNLSELKKHLSELNYPKDKYEIIIVDDNSTDGSFEYAKQIFSDFSNIKIIKAYKKKFSNKKGALDYGINYCSNEFIALTDADCMPEKEWLNKLSYALSKSDIAFGAAPLISSNSFASKFSAYESGKNQIINLLALRIGIPFSATGRNFAYRKSALQKSGGYSKTTDTISGDDDLLIREALINNMKIGFIEAVNGRVLSKSAENWKIYFKQRIRHLKTSHHYKLKQKIFSAIYYTSEIVLTYSFLFSFGGIFFPFISLLKFKITYSAIEKNKFFFHKKPSLFSFIIFELLFPIILIINFASSFVFDVSWKNKKGETK